MYIDFNKLAENSRLWVYGSSRVFKEADKVEIQNVIVAFLQKWSHHGKSLTCS